MNKNYISRHSSGSVALSPTVSSRLGVKDTKQCLPCIKPTFSVGNWNLMHRSKSPKLKKLNENRPDWVFAHVSKTIFWN
jgi:hypothetical protein